MATTTATGQPPQRHSLCQGRVQSLVRSSLTKLFLSRDITRTVQTTMLRASQPHYATSQLQQQPTVPQRPISWPNGM